MRYVLLCINADGYLASCRCEGLECSGAAAPMRNHKNVALHSYAKKTVKVSAMATNTVNVGSIQGILIKN